MITHFLQISEVDANSLHVPKAGYNRSCMSLTSEGTDTSSIYSTDDYNDEHGSSTRFIEDNEEIKLKLQDFTRDMQKLTDDSNNNTIIIDKEETMHDSNTTTTEKEEVTHSDNVVIIQKEEATHNDSAIITEKDETTQTTIEETAKDIPTVEISFGNDENKTRGDDDDSKSIKFNHTKHDIDNQEKEDEYESGIGSCGNTPDSSKTNYPYKDEENCEITSDFSKTNYPYADDDVDDDSIRRQLCASEDDEVHDIYVETKFLQIHGSKDDVNREVIESEEKDVPLASSTPVPKLRKTKPSKEVLLGNGIHH